MDNGQRLSFGEFLADLRGVVTSPGRCFPAIHERGAMWGSLLLLLAPVYFTLHFLGGIYFDHDPFPGYSFILPLLGAMVLTFLKLFAIHFIARLFEGKWRFWAATGKFRDLAVVFGYTGLPSIFALLLALVLFIAIPAQLAALFRDFRVITTSVLIAVSIALFIWNLILMVLALRTVYHIRDIKIVVSILLGPLLAAIPALGIMLATAPVHIDFSMLAPLFNEEVTRFVASDPESQQAERNKLSIHVDFLVYRLQTPKRFELVAFSQFHEEGQRRPRKGWRIIFRPFQWGRSDELKRQLAGRIVGLPGDEVELTQGKLRINGGYWDEPYIAPECRSDALVPATKLGPSDYLILPEDRRLIEMYRGQLVVDRARITGRLISNRWPLGWWLFRPTAFMKAAPMN